MRKLFLLLLVIIAFGCESDLNPGELKLRVYENAKLDENTAKVSPGTSLVFHFYHVKADEVNIADDELTEEFFIEMATEGDEIVISSESLALHHLPHAYRQYCYCVYIHRTSISAFDIVGNRLSSGDWELIATVKLGLETLNNNDEVVYHFERTLLLDGVYNLSPIAQE